MTTPTDADREAAAKWFQLCITHNPHADPVATLEKAFAAHRLLGQRQGIEMAALEARVCWHEGIPPAEFAKHIRNLAPEAEQ